MLKTLKDKASHLQHQIENQRNELNQNVHNLSMSQLSAEDELRLDSD